ncbi:LysR family transcriptional regulator [Terrisporobacter sp.]
MELRILRYFLAVAREESISGAAEVLHLSQPTLSRQLMQLEKDLGKQLLIRGNRKVTLTDDGVLLKKRAMEILDLVEKTENEINSSDKIISGDIYIGSGESDAMHIIAKTIQKIQKNHPHIRFHLFSGNADDVGERLDKGLLDFGILIEPTNIKKYDYLKLPATDTWGLLMRKDSHLANKDTISPKDLDNIPLLCSRQSLVGNNISSWYGDNYEKLNIIATYNLIYNASIMVEEGIGYALCLDKLINTTGNSVLCFKPLNPSLVVNLNIVWKKSQIFSKAANAFLKQLQEDINLS